jgi:histidinol-phosphate aminotransferase
MPDAFKPHLASLAPYPYRKVEARVKLDQNESPEDLPAAIKARALERLAAAPWNRYPDLAGESVRAAVARFAGWSEAGVAVAPGSNFLVLALGQAARRIADTAPSFAYYEGAARLSGVDYRAVRLGTEGDRFTLPVGGLLAALAGEPGVLFLSVPHAPTGALFPRDQVEAVVQAATRTGWLTVLDEAYHQFAGSDLRDLARANPSVCLLRTFSKAWCLGGIRGGYLLGSAEVAGKIQAMLPPFLVPAHTEAILLSALEAPGYVADLARRIAAERDRLVAGLAGHRTWKAHPSSTNFVLVRTPDARAAYEGLLARGILVRRQDHYPGLQGCIRVSAGAPAENDAFLAAASQLA